MNSLTVRLTASIALVVGAVLFGMILAGGLDLTTETLATTPSLSEAQQERGVLRVASKNPDPVVASANAAVASFADLAEAVLPAVATVNSTTVQQIDANEQDLFRMLPGRGNGDAPSERPLRGVGSGFFISPEGWMVTNHHVVDGATSISVRVDEETFDAEVKGSDPSTDLALLKVEGDGFPYLELGDSDDLRVGDWVMAVGSPLGFGSSVTVGVVSAKGRILGITGDRAFDDFIQTDAAINRGNSGGPLVNTRGQVVGVSTAMRVAAENIGFAVPAKILVDVVPQLRGEGRVSRGYLGVSIGDLDEDLVAVLKGVDSTEGVLITSIRAEPARKAGLRHQDVVLSVDGVRVANGAELIAQVSRRRPGDTIALDLIRRGKRISKQVTLGDREEGLAQTTIPVVIEEPEEETPDLDWLDAEVIELDRELRRRMALDPTVDGVVLTQIGGSSQLAEKGVQEFDLVREVNGEPVGTVEEFKQAIADVRPGERVLLFIQSPRRGGFQDFVVLRVPED